MIFGVDVIVVAPGTIATPIWAKANAVDVTPFADSAYAPAISRLKRFMISNGQQGLPPERIGEIVRTALTAARPKTRYTVTPNPLQNLLAPILPKRVVDGVIARRLALKS
jgi:NAD(P)-dependent dehydrogenase (short-subunit alcohol dehydrogenase family)